MKQVFSLLLVATLALFTAHSIAQEPVDECNANKSCPNGNYCHLSLCVARLQEDMACTQHGQCLEGSECVYGRCKAGQSAGDLGTFCESKEDCTGENVRCVLEPVINPDTSICKPALTENQVCYTPDTSSEEESGCEQGLSCKKVGIFGETKVCAK